jgi:predicted RNase H-like HicB family nuclease
MKKQHVPIVTGNDEDGFFVVSCPLFTGCHICGTTIDEAPEHIREVIGLCLEETGPENTFEGFRELEIDQEA